MKRPLISIVNSSTFGKHFKEHISAIEQFADVRHITAPSDIDPESLAGLIKTSNGIIASVTPRFPGRVLEQCSNLILLVRHGIGCDNVDLQAANELGIMVSRVKGLVEREAVAEYAVALLMAASRMVPHGYQAVKDSLWVERFRMVGMELQGKTIGIIGLGNIGSRTAEILSKGFKANVVAVDPYIKKDRFQQFNTTEVSLKELISSAHAILFHCPLTAETERMFDKIQFSAMQKNCILVNTCRGELVEENALYHALRDGIIGAYATDVVEGEPVDGNHRLAKLENVIITPHLGGYSWESLRGMGLTCVDDMISVFQQGGIPGELANPEVLKQTVRKWH